MAADPITKDEAQRLRARFAPLKAKRGAIANFAREFAVPGGPSMVSQHCSGNRPISLDAAIAYARGFGVKIEDISPRLARQVETALAAGQPPGESGPEGEVVTNEEWRLFRAFRLLSPEEQKQAREHLEEFAVKVLGRRALEGDGKPPPEKPKGPSTG